MIRMGKSTRDKWVKYETFFDSDYLKIYEQFQFQAQTGHSTLAPDRGKSLNFMPYRSPYVLGYP